jgi:nitrite reductase (cytochrome c-552)
MKIGKTRARNLIIAGVVCSLVLALVACVETGKTPTTEAPPQPKAPVAATPTMAKNDAGVWTAEAWKDIYPHEYQTYMDNKMNDTDGNAADPHFLERGDMVKMYPMLPTIWAGSAFNKFYNEPNGHNYSLDDIRVSGRVWDAEKGAWKETAFANCMTCKSADYTALYQQQGDEIFAKPIGEIDALISEPISCYNCHENNLATDATVSSVVNTQKFFADGLGSDASKVDVKSQSCGQCHNEYYFAPGTRAVTNPYSGLASMTPEKMYEYYKTAGKDGAPFVDYTNPNTGVTQLKTQHPEFEFVFGGDGASMTKRINPATGDTFGCADCHMGNKVVADDNTEYTSHLLISPLENKELLATSCNVTGCHLDLASQVKDWQKESEDRVMEIGKKLEDLNIKLAEAVANNSLSEADLAAVRELNRESQWYWDYVMVENSEGAHNPTLSNKTLDLSEKAVNKALEYFE